MDSDFHYYGTATAALAGGFDAKQAQLIANVAQYVDWFDSDYWSYWRFVDKGGRAVRDIDGDQYQYKYPQLSVQKIDWKMSMDFNPSIWNPFHFPPGNLPYSTDKGGWRELFAKHHQVRKTILSKADVNKLCRPFSKFALDMIEDTIITYNKLVNAKGKALEQLVNELVSPRVRCPVTDGRKLALYILGVRMHVLSDTWAHQDFTGEQNSNINEAGTTNKVVAKDADGDYQKTQWTGTVWVLGEDTDCAAAPSPALGGSKVCAGHGQLGHYPDYSWMEFKYPARWLSKTGELHERNNPKEYDQAWSWISFVMSQINGKNLEYPAKTPNDITTVMKTWHQLSNKRLRAVADSEAKWRSTELGKQIDDRWDPADREKLGLYDGLAKTRYGYINIRQNSRLHYMEIASAMHYQFCVKWIKDNPEYSWKPWQPKT